MRPVVQHPRIGALGGEQGSDVSFTRSSSLDLGAMAKHQAPGAPLEPLSRRHLELAGIQNDRNLLEGPLLQAGAHGLHRNGRHASWGASGRNEQC
jgi:hypothetical protein